MSTGRVHHFKPHAPYLDALKWLLEHTLQVNGTIIFDNNSSIMIVDGVYHSIDVDEE
jgi:hypothetical protein